MVERNEAEISRILEERLDSVLSGKTSLDEALNDYPQYEQELRRDLEAALWLRSGQTSVQSRPGYLSASKKRVMSRIKAEAASRPVTRSAQARPVLPRMRLARVFAAALVVIFVFFAGAGAVVSAAQTALPGEQLYPVKLVSENAAVSLSSSDARKVELRTSFAGRRLAEAETMIVQGEIALAQQAVAVYELEVQQAVRIVQAIDNLRPEEKKAAATRLADELVTHTDHLEVLAQTAPEEMRPALAGAINVSTSGAATAGDALEDALEQQNTPTLTPTPDPLQLLDQTQTSQAAETAVDDTSVTPGDKDKKVTHTPKPTNEIKPTHTPKPTKEIKPTHTPKPTNEKKPTHTPKPAKENKVTEASQPSDDSSGDSSEDESSKPDKEVKPTKEKKDK